MPSDHRTDSDDAAAAVDVPSIHWTERGTDRSARWRSERAAPAPRRIEVVDDTISADAAYRLACEGTALLWRGDFHNARQLLQAMARRTRQTPRRKLRAAKAQPRPERPEEAFHQHRRLQAQHGRILSQLLVPIAADYTVEAGRAPDVRLACSHAWGPADDRPSVVALRELLGIVGAYEWYRKGVPIPALGPTPDDRIHAHYGVFSPLRGEYVDLVAKAALPAGGVKLAFDIATGTGVLACVLARRGIPRVVATERDPRALACARENVARLGLAGQVDVVAADLFPTGTDARADLVVCNPPWLPARASAPIERAVYDEDSRMLRAYLQALPAHLNPGGEGWLVLSDLAERLGLRTRDELLAWITAAGLTVLDRLDIRPRHPKASDPDDPLHAARAAEITSLWKLGVER
jgi:SAM-dependent methyltransferase